MEQYMELENCKLCAWECGVDRLAGEKGVCMTGLPVVASCQLHSAPPQSYTVFTAGCNFRCLNCQNYDIAHYPAIKASIRGRINPERIGREGVNKIQSSQGQLIGADRFFFSGGSPTVSLPWIEEVVGHAKKLDPTVKVNFDTNGFPTKESFYRILSFSDSITFDIKAYHEETHRALTGAPVEPVLQNVERMVKNKEKLWEFRILVIPNIVDHSEVQAIAEFLASLDETVPICFLAFRPNFCLDKHPGATKKLMRKVVDIAQNVGLANVKWAGFPNIYGTILYPPPEFLEKFTYKQAGFAAYYAQQADCQQIHRNCGDCAYQQNCHVKVYSPYRRT